LLFYALFVWFTWVIGSIPRFPRVCVLWAPAAHVPVFDQVVCFLCAPPPVRVPQHSRPLPVPLSPCCGGCCWAALGEEPVGVCEGPCHALERPLQDPVPAALRVSLRLSLSLSIPPRPPTHRRCHPVGHPGDVMPHGWTVSLCVCVTVGVLPHPGVRRARPCSARGHHRRSRPLPAGADAWCPLSCLPTAPLPGVSPHLVHPQLPRCVPNSPPAAAGRSLTPPEPPLLSLSAPFVPTAASPARLAPPGRALAVLTFAACGGWSLGAAGVSKLPVLGVPAQERQSSSPLQPAA